ncbi:MAG TPA: prolyl-tRNA synthetase associated domain-containing protein [Bacteroidales bacterium]|nr:prolyl-tRNA synthetase associated domain-containing protein [Bacteroidales bacterium]
MSQLSPTMMNGDINLYNRLKELNIGFDYYEHPPAPTIEDARKYWKDIEAAHCKNLFFRNHKGDRHYLVVIEHTKELRIHVLEKRLKQGKISFASPERMHKYLGVTPGSVSPFGLINDSGNHVHVFFDESLQTAERISFHPNINTASIVLKLPDFMHFMHASGNSFEFISL